MMLADALSVPGAGGLAAAGILYAGLSLFVTGPLVAERSIEKSGWQAACERRLTARDHGSDAGSGVAECPVLLGLVFGAEGAAFCHRHGDALSAAARLAQSITRVNGTDARSSCDCAIRTVVESRRTDFALHAGSLRLVTPRPVRALEAELGAALTGPACRGRSS